jgi:hypothetical protein
MTLIELKEKYLKLCETFGEKPFDTDKSSFDELKNQIYNHWSMSYDFTEQLDKICTLAQSSQLD